MKNGKQELVSTTYKPPIDISAAAEAKEVKQFADLFEAAVHNGLYIPGVKSQSNTHHKKYGLTVEEFVQEHYFDRIEAKFSPNTVPFYRSVTEQLIIPNFGKIRLSDIHVKHLQALIDYLNSPGSRADETNQTALSGATIKRYSTVFRSIISEAYKMGFTEENAFYKQPVEYPKVVRPKLEVYDDHEANLFFNALKNEPLQTQLILLCALLLGMRRAEIISLRWSDIDFEKSTIYIHESAFKKKGKPQSTKSTKSPCSVRTVFFPPIFAEVLAEWKIEQEKIKQKAGTLWNNFDFIITNFQGKMRNIGYPTKICNKFEAKNNLHHLKFHGLRHTCGSLMVANGVDIETVKTILGHEDIKTTKIYVHPYEKNLRSAADILEKVIATPESESNF